MPPDGCLTVAEALDLRRDGVSGRGGWHRHPPPTPGHRRPGCIFFNLEDETGLLNVVVLPDVWTVHREVARRNPGW